MYKHFERGLIFKILFSLYNNFGIVFLIYRLICFRLILNRYIFKFCQLLSRLNYNYTWISGLPVDSAQKTHKQTVLNSKYTRVYHLTRQSQWKMNCTNFNTELTTQLHWLSRRTDCTSPHTLDSTSNRAYPLMYCSMSTPT